MANTLDQSVTQYTAITPPRVLVQYSVGGVHGFQKEVSYTDLTADQKTIFDAYKTLCETLMNS